jgi:hypothetical protein
MYIRRGRDSPPLRKGKREGEGSISIEGKRRKPSLEKKIKRRGREVYIYIEGNKGICLYIKRYMYIIERVRDICYLFI